MNPDYLFVLLLSLHFLGDYVLQSSWMAANKSTNGYALHGHVSVYSLVFFAGLVAWFPGWGLFAFLCANYLIHAVIDSQTSWTREWLLVREYRHGAVIVSGLDQWLHVLTVYFLGKLLI